MNRQQMRLYAVTDRTWLHGALSEAVELALQGGATTIQLRDKNVTDDALVMEALSIQPLCKKYHALFIINDRVDLVLDCKADGVHVGQSDMEIAEARRILGPGKVIGASAHSVEEARQAEAAGADYLGAGSVFQTNTKQDAGHLPFETLQKICQAVQIPVVAIGGITEQNMGLLVGSGISGIAVVSAIFAQTDILASASRLRNFTEQF